MLSVGSERLGNALKLKIRGTLSLQMESLKLTLLCYLKHRYMQVSGVKYFLRVCYHILIL